MDSKNSTMKKMYPEAISQLVAHSRNIQASVGDKYIAIFLTTANKGALFDKLFAQVHARNLFIDVVLSQTKSD